MSSTGITGVLDLTRRKVGKAIDNTRDLDEDTRRLKLTVAIYAPRERINTSQSIPSMALFDSGSQRTFVIEDVVHELDLTPRPRQE